MPFLNLHGVDYYYRVIGSGPVLVLLHGFTGSTQNWETLYTSLAGKYRIIAVDLLGHGRTAAPPDPLRYSMEASAQDLAALLSLLAPAPFHLLGYSMGGRLALYFALHYPEQVQRLILESASPGLDDDEARRQRMAQDEALAQRIEREGIKAFVDYWQGIPLFASQQRLPQNVRERLRQQRLQNRPEGLANSLRGMGTGVQPSLWGQLGQLQMPVHLIVGKMDTKFVEINQQMAAQIPQASLTVVPDAGHAVHLEKGEEFAGLVGDRLAS